MKRYTIDVVDEDGDLLLTITTQFHSGGSDDAAKQYVVPLLPAIAKQYGVTKAFYSTRGI